MKICDSGHFRIVFTGTVCPLCEALKDSRRVIEARKVLAVLKDSPDPAEAASRGYWMLFDALNK